MTESTRNDTITERADAPAPASTAEDSELLQLCAEFNAQRDRLHELLKDMDAEEGNAADLAMELYMALLDRVGETTAKTIPGLIAKARITSMIIRGENGDPEREFFNHDIYFGLTLAEDLVAFGHSRATA